MRCNRVFVSKIERCRHETMKLVNIAIDEQTIKDNMNLAKAVYEKLNSILEDATSRSDICGQAWFYQWLLRMQFNHFLTGKESEEEQAKIISRTNDCLEYAVSLGNPHARQRQAELNKGKDISKTTSLPSPFLK